MSGLITASYSSYYGADNIQSGSSESQVSSNNSASSRQVASDAGPAETQNSPALSPAIATSLNELSCETRVFDSSASSADSSPYASYMIAHQGSSTRLSDASGAESSSNQHDNEQDSNKSTETEAEYNEENNISANAAPSSSEYDSSLESPDSSTLSDDPSSADYNIANS